MASYLDPEAIVPRPRERRRRRPSRLRVPRREAAFAEAVVGAGLTWVGPPPACFAPPATSSTQAPRRGAACRRSRPASRRRSVPAAREGGRRRRRARHAARPRARTTRRRARSRAARGGGRVRGRACLLRALRRTGAPRRGAAPRRRARDDDRARRAGLLHPAPPPEGARGDARPAVDAALRARDLRCGRRDRAPPATWAPARPSSCADGGRFWFLELNARIQVEHPVTEARHRHRPRRAAAADRGRRAARIASSTRGPRGRGAPLRRGSADVPAAGRPGRAAQLPDGDARRRGVDAGDEVPVAYDPLIAKLVAHGGTREEALNGLAAALAETDVGGVTTASPSSAGSSRHPVVRAGRRDDRVPRGTPAPLAPPRRPRPSRGVLAAQPPPRRRSPPRPPPGRGRARTGAARTAGGGARADARHGAPCPRRRGRRSRRASRCRSRGDEDGDAARLALRRDGRARPRRRGRPGAGGRRARRARRPRGCATRRPPSTGCSADHV